MIPSPQQFDKSYKTVQNPGDLEEEQRIVWTRPTDELTYVRSSLKRTTKRTGEPPRNTGNLIGYGVLSPDANPDSRYVHRRVFWLKDNDRGMGNDDFSTWRSQLPAEGVDPQTVGPGVPGKKTPRARGLYYNPLVPIISGSDDASVVEEPMREASVPYLTIHKSRKYALVQLDWASLEGCEPPEEQREEISRILERWVEIESMNPQNKKGAETMVGGSLQEIGNMTLRAAEGCADELAQAVWPSWFVPDWDSQR